MNLKDALKKTAEEISFDLGLDPNNCEYKYLETKGIGADYTASNRSNGLCFDLHISVDSDDEPTIGDVHASLNIDFNDNRTSSFYYSEKINFINGSRHLLSRWGSKAIAVYRKDYDKFEPELIFRDSNIIVYGMPLSVTRCLVEADYLLNGMTRLGQDSTTIYKIRHLRADDNYRSFSYAIYVENRNSYYSYWAVFPDANGIDSGGAYSHYRRFEALIEMLSETVNVEIIYKDYPFELFHRFLYENSVGFHKYPPETLPTLLDFHDLNYSQILKNSQASVARFLEGYEKSDYSFALRDLRPLVQQALENLLNHHVLSLGSSQVNINNLAGKLISSGFIDGKLKTWFETFCSIANPATHRDYPTNEDLSNHVSKNRVLLAIQIGVQLIREINLVYSNDSF